ncbi:MAG TPA: 30S ribosomal protein S20 [Clostridiales bacterium]|nr:30S ribosomal protein S20 [Clostridiales bacterium]
MPNIKSAKKRVLVSNKKAAQNKMIKNEVRTYVKKVELLVNEGKTEEAKSALNETFSAIDSAVSKGVLHRNNAANKKAKLSKKVNG